MIANEQTDDLPCNARALCKLEFVCDDSVWYTDAQGHGCTVWAERDCYDVETWLGHGYFEYDVIA